MAAHREIAVKRQPASQLPGSLYLVYTASPEISQASLKTPTSKKPFCSLQHWTQLQFQGLLGGDGNTKEGKISDETLEGKSQKLHISTLTPHRNTF